MHERKVELAFGRLVHLIFHLCLVNCEAQVNGLLKDQEVVETKFYHRPQIGNLKDKSVHWKLVGIYVLIIQIVQELLLLLSGTEKVTDIATFI